jgi:hypothetical protein
VDSATGVLFQYGLAGVVIFGLTIAVIKLYGDNIKLQGKIDDEKDARRIDARETLDKVAEPLRSISQTTEYILDKLVISKKGSR